MNERNKQGLIYQVKLTFFLGEFHNQWIGNLYRWMIRNQWNRLSKTVVLGFFVVVVVFFCCCWLVIPSIRNWIFSSTFQMMISLDRTFILRMTTRKSIKNSHCSFTLICSATYSNVFPHHPMKTNSRSTMPWRMKERSKKTNINWTSWAFKELLYKLL